MKPTTTNHEVLLFTGTSFTNREFCSKNDEKDNGREFSSLEELKKACWAGALCELLPEILDYPSAKNENFIWNIVSGDHFLYIDIGPYPLIAEKETSIDPYFFLQTFYKN